MTIRKKLLLIFTLFLIAASFGMLRFIQNYRENAKAPENKVTLQKSPKVQPDVAANKGITAEFLKADQNLNQTGAVIAFTFDDGYLSDYQLAYPVLKQYGIHGTSYIIPKYQDENKPNTLTWDQIKEMLQYGWVFGCHTYSHSDLTKMTAEEISESMEMVDASFARQGLEPPAIHAFPYGRYNQDVIQAIAPYRIQMRKAYYESKFVDLNNVNPYEIDSCSADMRTEKRLKLHESLVDKASAQNGVIVFRCHGLYREKVDDMGAWPVQTDSKLFEELVAYCVEKGCKFITMTELIEMYSD